LGSSSAYMALGRSKALEAQSGGSSYPSRSSCAYTVTWSQATDLTPAYQTSPSQSSRTFPVIPYLSCPGQIPNIFPLPLDHLITLVGDRACQSVPNLHISSPGERARYVALSYCWGGTQKVVTTLRTLSEHINTISLEILPRTIRDAIQVTKQLGIRFLWVDSLCIVQDDGVDKDKEIKLMGGIYKNAKRLWHRTQQPSIMAF